jgi:hypothetical protein
MRAHVLTNCEYVHFLWPLAQAAQKYRQDAGAGRMTVAQAQQREQDLDTRQTRAIPTEDFTVYAGHDFTILSDYTEAVAAAESAVELRFQGHNNQAPSQMRRAWTLMNDLWRRLTASCPAGYSKPRSSCATVKRDMQGVVSRLAAFIDDAPSMDEATAQSRGGQLTRMISDVFHYHGYPGGWVQVIDDADQVVLQIQGGISSRRFAQKGTYDESVPRAWQYWDKVKVEIQDLCTGKRVQPQAPLDAGIPRDKIIVEGSSVGSSQPAAIAGPEPGGPLVLPSAWTILWRYDCSVAQYRRFVLTVTKPGGSVVLATITRKDGHVHGQGRVTMHMSGKLWVMVTTYCEHDWVITR